jgi:hypothetical protein
MAALYTRGGLPLLSRRWRFGGAAEAHSAKKENRHETDRTPARHHQEMAEGPQGHPIVSIVQIEQDEDSAIPGIRC